jgi:hypothetical protein
VEGVLTSSTLFTFLFILLIGKEPFVSIDIVTPTGSIAFISVFISFICKSGSPPVMQIYYLTKVPNLDLFIFFKRITCITHATGKITTACSYKKGVSANKCTFSLKRTEYF